MSIQNERADRTITIKPWGSLPIKDARKNVELLLTDFHIKRGKKFNPTECAIAQCGLDSGDDIFPGKFLFLEVLKTAVHVVTIQRGKLRVLRYVFSESTRKGINGFDTSPLSSQALKAGSITLFAPWGSKRLGMDKRGISGYHKSTSQVGASRRECKKRGLYKYNRDEMLAKKQETE